jgi:hypothetical protein
MKVLVCGSRLFAIDSESADGKSVVWAHLDKFDPRGLSLITGGALGPDDWARDWAEQTKIDHHVLYAQWEDHGKRAGILRNLAMLDLKPDLVLAFWDGKSSGTAHTISEARRRGIAVEVINEP